MNAPSARDKSYLPVLDPLIPEIAHLTLFPFLLLNLCNNGAPEIGEEVAARVLARVPAAVAGASVGGEIRGGEEQLDRDVAG